MDAFANGGGRPGRRRILMHRTVPLHPSSRPLPATCAVLAIAMAATLLVAGDPTPARAAVSADINIRVGDRPAPVVVFQDEPEVVLVPRSRVYYVEHSGYDLYRYGRYWYINDSGFWFRAASYRGPFVGIELRHVPRSITVVPARYRRHPAHPHGGPPGQLKNQRTVVLEDLGQDRDVIVVEKSKGGRGHKGD
jgi:hypothetical protein